MSLTFGAATATLFVMGAILVGPALTACAGEDGFGSCLRQGLEDRGLLAPRPPLFAEMPELPRFDPRPEGEIAVDVAQALPTPATTVALEELRGGIGTSVTMRLDPVVTAAMAGELDGSLVASPAEATGPEKQGAELVEAGGTLEAAVVDGPSLQAGEASLRAQGGLIVASGDLRQGFAYTGVTLAPEPVVLGAAATEPRSDEPAAAGLKVTSGAMSVAGSVAASAAPAIARLSSSTGVLSAGGEWGAAASVPVDIAPLAADEPIALDVVAEPPARAAVSDVALLPAETEPAPEPEPQPEPAPPPVAPKPAVPQFVYNPAFPNVILLPPPQRGENSAIQTLQLD